MVQADDVFVQLFLCGWASTCKLSVIVLWHNGIHASFMQFSVWGAAIRWRFVPATTSARCCNWLVTCYDLWFEHTLPHHFCHMPHEEGRPATTSARCCNWFVICNNVKFAFSSSCPFYARTNAAWCPQLTSIQAAPMESSQQPHLHAVVNRFVTCCDLWFVICHLACRLCHERVWPDLLGKPREKATVCSTSGS